MKKIGHRGAKAWVDENTLESITKAIEFGVDAIEIDVHRCLTGELIVIHDFTLNRTTNSWGSVRKRTYIQLLKLKTSAGYKIPTLTQVLDHCRGKCDVHIELKGKRTGKPTSELIEELVRQGSWTYNQLFVSSFAKKRLKKIRENFPKIQLGLIAVRRLHKALRYTTDRKYEAIYVHHSKITKRLVDVAKQKGVQLFAWTVNKEKDIAKMKNLQVNGIISDYPNLL